MKLAIFFAALFLSACANRTTMQSTWVDDEYAGAALDRIAVAAMFETRADSLAFELKAVDYLGAEGVATVPAHALLAPAEAQRLDESSVRERLATADVDGILIFRLIAVDERREYQVPTPYLLNGALAPVTRYGLPPCYEPGSSYYCFSSPLPGVSASSRYSEGYWSEQTFLIAETALFDNRNDRLVWTGKSATLDDARFERTSESIVRSVARRLFAMDLIARMDGNFNSEPRSGRG